MPHRRIRVIGSDEERLRAKYRVNPDTDCWEWVGSMTPLGYGQFRFRGTRELAHRVSWTLFRGEIPKGKGVYGTTNVLHRCDNPKCVNPDHLFLGDQSDNALDSVSKKRWGPRGCKGELHGRAKLTEEQVIQIRDASIPALQAAAQFGISKSTVQHIRKRRTWTHI